MTPRTRSGKSDAQEDRVYESTPIVRQVQFPARHTRIRPTTRRTERSQELPPPSTAERLKQQTLTQIDFVSSSFLEEDVVAMSSDSDVRDTDSAKENPKRKAKSLGMSNFKYEMPQSDGESESEDDAPTTRRRKRKPSDKSAADKSKRRRTIGEDVSANIRRNSQKSRRKTLGDPPASSNYHTQTLTQFVGRDSFVADSDDEDLGGNEDDGFLSWLGNDDSENQNHQESISELVAAPAGKAREESVVPQTPVKNIRFELPDSDQGSGPTSLKVARYGAPDVQTSPSQRQSDAASPSVPRLSNLTPSKAPTLRNKLVIEDSYATESWASQHTTPTKKTPTKSRSQNCIGTSPVKATPTRSTTSTLLPSMSLDEIPDSDDDEGFTQDMVEEPSQPFAPTNEGRSAAEEPETQSVVDDVVHLTTKDGPNAPETFHVGNETQLIMEQLQSSASQWNKTPTKPNNATEQHEIPSSIQTSQSSAPFSSAKEHPSPSQPKQKRVRQPLSQPGSTNTQGFPLESQRVAVSILHSFPPADVRSDILLPVSAASLSQLLQGYTVTLSLPFKVPPQVARFWLLDRHNLQHMAVVDGTVEQQQLQGNKWLHTIHQVYELNNPVSEEDIRAEEWIVGSIGKYKYLPPVYVSQLLWNLSHALFSDAEQHQQQQQQQQNHKEEAQDQQANHLTDDASKQPASSSHLPTQNLIPSTAHAEDDDDENDQFHEASSQRLSNTMPPPSLPASASQRPPTSSRPNPPPPPVASQATTASQASPSQPQPSLTEGASLHRHIPDPDANPNPSSDSVVFIDPSGSSLQIPDHLLDSYAYGADTSDSNFQLLTKSQLLPDSLLRDDAHLPNEIWDSSEE